MKQFTIPCSIPTKNKNIKFPNDLIKDVEEAIEGKNCTFTAFVVEATKVAVKNVSKK